MKTEHSYGALLYFLSQGIRYFVLIGAIRKQKTEESDTVGIMPTSYSIEYGFPKGHPEARDTCVLDTVIREVHEETGISKDSLLITKFNEKKSAFSLSYLISKNGEIKNKTSTYYPLEMKTIDPNTLLLVPRDFVYEIADIVIVAEDKVHTVLHHDDEKRLFEKWRRG